MDWPCWPEPRWRAHRPRTRHRSAREVTEPRRTEFELAGPARTGQAPTGSAQTARPDQRLSVPARCRSRTATRSPSSRAARFELVGRINITDADLLFAPIPVLVTG